MHIFVLDDVARAIVVVIIYSCSSILFTPSELCGVVGTCNLARIGGHRGGSLEVCHPLSHEGNWPSEWKGKTRLVLPLGLILLLFDPAYYFFPFCILLFSGVYSSLRVALSLTCQASAYQDKISAGGAAHTYSPQSLVMPRNVSVSLIYSSPSKPREVLLCCSLHHCSPWAIPGNAGL